MKTRKTKKALVEHLKKQVKEYREWYFEVNQLDISDEAKALFFARQCNALLDEIECFANKIRRNDLKR